MNTKMNKIKHRDPSPKKHGGKLARRAKSFKDDFMGKINQIRNTPAGSGSSTSPRKPSPKYKPKDPNNSTLPKDKKLPPQKDFELTLLSSEKLLNSALRYFKDVVDKDKLEMLPGCATEVLLSVLAIKGLMKERLVSKQSSILTSASNKLYQSLANLIRWSDNVALLGKKSQTIEDVSDVVQAVQDSVQNLTKLIIEMLQNKTLRMNGSGGSIKSQSDRSSSPLPDIPLTPRERDLFEQSSLVSNGRSKHALNHSVSSDSILNTANHSNGLKEWDDIPPKPPLPSLVFRQQDALSGRPLSYGDETDSTEIFNSGPLSAPPLPPKRRMTDRSSLNNDINISDCYITDPTSPNPDMSSSFYDNADGPGFSFTSNNFKAQFSSKSNYSYRTDWHYRSRSPDSASSVSKSPTSSMDSILDKSTEDVMSSVYKSSNSNFTPMDVDVVSKNAVSYTSINKSSREYKYSSYSSSNSSKQTNEEICLQMSSSSTSSHHSSNSLHDQMVGQNRPALPVKYRKSIGSHSRTPSQYDNVPDLLLPTLDKRLNADEEVVQLRHHRISPEHHKVSSQQSYIVSKEVAYRSAELGSDSQVKHTRTAHSKSSSAAIVSCPVHGSSSDNQPPPLPPKKKNIMAYMQMLGKYSCPNENEFYRHSVHTHNLVQAQVKQKQTEPRCYTMYNSESWFSASKQNSFFCQQSANFGSSKSFDNDLGSNEFSSPPILPPKKNRYSTSSLGRPKRLSSPTTPRNSISLSTNKSCNEKSLVTPMRQLSITSQDSHLASDSVFKESLLDRLDVSEYLVYKNTKEEGPEIRGGPVDALVIHASESAKKGQLDYIYEEVFLVTYRTFIATKLLVDKLLYRYKKFIIRTDMEHQRAAHNAFSLLARVIDVFCVGDLESGVMHDITEFISELVSEGNLDLAKFLREKIMEKCRTRQEAKHMNSVLLPELTYSTRPAMLLDFKAKHIAKQMTLMDAELFELIEIPEVLLWAREQSEELSPNLTTFTEHFNKMSFWARSRILEQNDAKEREKFVLKFINIMKHLRMLNNFNSYLALLSALDSAPIRRLEWQKDITEGLQEYCRLIDSSSSFRAYRQALAETEPPCIPYIGLILQDLTFVHIGNNDHLPDGNINFAKRWQQFNILDNMNRFKKCLYTIKKNEKIIGFFKNFDNYLCEDAMWHISETIKPRGGKKKISEQS